MTVGEFADSLDMSVLAGAGGLNKEVAGVYVCDLLSWVMSHANKGDAWVTVLTNLNVAAVALLAEVACVIIPEGIEAEAAVLKRADQEGIPILGTGMKAYEICIRAQKLLEN